jgi:hypothetical protein
VSFQNGDEIVRLNAALAKSDADRQNLRDQMGAEKAILEDQLAKLQLKYSVDTTALATELQERVARVGKLEARLQEVLNLLTKKL